MMVKYYKNIFTSNKILIQIQRKRLVSWDFLSTGFILNKQGWEKIREVILSLPIEAFNVNKRHWMGMGQIYTCFNLNHKYLSIGNNIETLVNQIKNIFEDEGNLNEYHSWKDEIQDFDIFLKEFMGSISGKYDYWRKKKKENSGYNRYKILERDGFKCRLCGRGPPEVLLHIDHWVPKSKGGLDVYENLLTLCSQCNQSKHAQIPKYKIEDILSGKMENNEN